jgi:hypothetical protein
MKKFILAALLLFVSNISYAVDLKKLDKQVAGEGCYYMVMYAYLITQDSRDKGEAIRLTKQRLDYNLYLSKGSPGSIALGEDYFIKLHAFMYHLAEDIWAAPELSAEQIRDMTRNNCDATNGETSWFIPLKTIVKLRQK